jgi:hypothetical protein
MNPTHPKPLFDGTLHELIADIVRNRPSNTPPGPAADLDETISVTPADILRGAARYLEIHGWIQGTFYAAFDPFPAACADGAIGMAVYGQQCGFPGEGEDPRYPEYRRALAWLVDYLKNHGHDVWPDVDPADIDSYGPDLFVWNDQLGQTAETVIAALREAADEYDWQHASEDDLETYADACVCNETHPDREGFLAWLARRAER